MKARIGEKEYDVLDMKGWRSFIGLMFNDMNEIDGALIYGNSIWMPFVKRPLTLIFLDDENKILQVDFAIPITTNPRTWKTYSCKKASKCLELKEKINPSIGERVLFSK